MTPQIVSASAAPAAYWVSLLLVLAALAGRVLLSATFIHAGVQKIRHHALLVGVIGNYRVLPEALAPLASWLLPPLELFLGLALLVPTSWSGLVAAGLLLLFTAAIITNLVRGRAYIDCGCFQSGLRQELGWELVLRNVALLGIAVYAACFPVRPTFVVGVLAVLFGLVSYTLYQALHALDANRSALRSLAAR
jgi:uncharacterized membrane protein YphA (DoxX/SURF4 family)